MGGGGELLLCSSMSPFVLLFSLCPSSSSRTKSVCDTISTPGIIAAATNAAEREKKEGGSVCVCDGVMSSQSICGLIQTQQPFRVKVEPVTWWPVAQCEN